MNVLLILLGMKTALGSSMTIVNFRESLEATTGRVGWKAAGVGGWGQIVKSHTYHFLTSWSQYQTGERED